MATPKPLVFLPVSEVGSVCSHAPSLASCIPVFTPFSHHVPGPVLGPQIWRRAGPRPARETGAQTDSSRTPPVSKPRKCEGEMEIPTIRQALLCREDSLQGSSEYQVCQWDRTSRTHSSSARKTVYPLKLRGLPTAMPSGPLGGGLCIWDYGCMFLHMLL